MRFAELADYLERLEETSSRLEMTRILAEMFSKTGAEEARLAAYLTQGRLGPAYKSPDFGVADKMMLRALPEGAEKVFKETGDLGKVAEKLAVGGKTKTGKLGVGEVYERLTRIATRGGEGSQEEKLKLIRELMEELTGREAKYAVKMILGKLRTGFSDMTVLDALSWMIVGDKSLRSKVEEMYNVRADLGEIAEELVRRKKPRAMEPELGTPVLMAKAERAASAGEIWERNGECAVEYKLDGLRIQAHVEKEKRRAVVLFSRGLEDVTAMYPDIVAGLEKQIGQECIVEGEMIAVGKDGRFAPFQETVQRKRKYGIKEKAKEIPLEIFLFDVLWVWGKNVMGETNKRRREILEGLVEGKGGTVKLIPRRLARSAGEIEEFFEAALKKETEGIIVKKLDSVYQAGSRNFNWIKYKKSYHKSALADTIDVVVMGYDAGQGKRAGFGIGDFLVGVYEPKGEKYLTTAKIGTGLTDEEWREMLRRLKLQANKRKPESYEVSKQMECDEYVEPKYVVEIQADEITKSPMHTSGLALRFPRFVGWREKKPEEATSKAELERLFKLQRK